ncbi:MAG: hypothetical protein ACYDHA_06545 [Bellilinea sp.]
MTSKNALRPFLQIALFLLLVILAACSADPGVTQAPPVDPSPSPGPTLADPPTPTPAPASVWLIAGPDVAVRLREDYSNVLANQAAQDNLAFEVKDSFRQSDLPADLKVALFLSPLDDISTLTANLPNTQFAAVTASDLQPAANFSVIRTADNQVAFLAGYLATLNAPDFRSGALFVDGAANSAQLQDSFLNGGRYFCGRCAPVFAPIVLFPQVGVVPANADAAGWQAAFDVLNQNNIEMLYLPTEGLLPDFLAYLAGKNVKIISNAPPPAGSEGLWVATVQSDTLAAIQALWPDLIAGTGGKTSQAGLALTNVNSANLSLGRQQLAEKIIPDLTSGIISPLSVP